MSEPGTITRAVNAVGVRTEDAVFPRVYAELRKLAAGQLAKETKNRVIEPTVLVHAAYLKLFGRGNPGWENRRHFYGAAANAMRQILIDEAKKRRTRREIQLGPHPATALIFGFSAWGPSELLALDEALKGLDAMDQRLSEIVRLRVFAERSMAQVAELLDLSVRQCDRDWRTAKAWLLRQMHGKDGGEPARPRDAVAPTVGAASSASEGKRRGR